MNLENLHNIHLNQRAFIVATGPSLQINDLEKLKNEITFSCNKIYLAFNSTTWRPKYYSVIDRLVAKNNSNTIKELKLKKIFSTVVKPYFKESNDIAWLNDLASPVVNNQRQFAFSKNAARGTYGGFTVVYAQLQLAYLMGIKTVYLIGLDFNFEKSMSTGEKTSANEEILKSSGEKNHFHSEYRKNGEKWTMPNLDYQYKAFKVAKKAFEDDNRKILNASRKTMLDIFERVEFDSLF